MSPGRGIREVSQGGSVVADRFAGHGVNLTLFWCKRSPHTFRLLRNADLHTVHVGCEDHRILRRRQLQS